MSEDQRSKEHKFKKKIQKKYSTFVEVVEGMNVSDLKSKMSIYARYEVETRQALKNDEQINQLSDTIKEMKAPYSETLSALKDKMSYIYFLLKDKDGGEES